MQNDLLFLKEVLSVPTVTYQEEFMIRFILDWLEENKIESLLNMIIDYLKQIYLLISHVLFPPTL